MDEQTLNEIRLEITRHLNLPTIDVSGQVDFPKPTITHIPHLTQQARMDGRLFKGVHILMAEPLPDDWRAELVNATIKYAEQNLISRHNGMVMSQIFHRLTRATRGNEFNIVFLYEYETQKIIRPLSEVIADMRSYDASWYGDILYYMDALPSHETLEHLAWEARNHVGDELYTELLEAYRVAISR